MSVLREFEIIWDTLIHFVTWNNWAGAFKISWGLGNLKRAHPSNLVGKGSMACWVWERCFEVEFRVNV